MGAFAGFELNQRTNRLSPLDGESLGAWLEARGMPPIQRKLVRLWKSWEEVMGPFASSAHPLGHRNEILLIGGEDSCILQELSYALPEILERANKFLEEDFFKKAELKLLVGSSLKEDGLPPLPNLPSPARPKNLGGLKLPENSPVAACYAAYLKYFAEKEIRDENPSASQALC